MPSKKTMREVADIDGLVKGVLTGKHVAPFGERTVITHPFDVAGDTISRHARGTLPPGVPIPAQHVLLYERMSNGLGGVFGPYAYSIEKCVDGQLLFYVPRDLWEIGSLYQQAKKDHLDDPRVTSLLTPRFAAVLAWAAVSPERAAAVLSALRLGATQDQLDALVAAEAAGDVR